MPPTTIYSILGLECAVCRGFSMCGLFHTCSGDAQAPLLANAVINAPPPAPAAAPPPPVMGGPPPMPGAQRASPLLNDSLALIYKPTSISRTGDVTHLPIFNRCTPKYQTALSAAPNAVKQKVLDALLSAMANQAVGVSQANQGVIATRLANTTVGAFKLMGEAGQLQFISGLWNLILENRTPGVKCSDAAMFEPTVRSDANKQPLASGFCPLNPGVDRFGWVNNRPSDRFTTPFKTLGIAFRAEGSTSGNNDLGRIQAQGMKAVTSTPGLLRALRGWEIEGTIVEDVSKVFFWTGNVDVLNETGCCVSRNFFGSTAFPERNSTEQDKNGVNVFYYLFAIDCNGLDAVDSEDYQLGKPNSKQWRPGEKVYKAIPAANILGYVLYQRNGAGPNGGWKFTIDANMQWTWLNGQPPGDQRVRDYLTDQLNSWKGHCYTIPPDYDFA